MPRDILLLAMSMDIGGAETHIYELALRLKKEGYNVAVCSGGGILVNDLEKNGIPHITAPLYNRKLLNIIKSYRIIKQYVEQHRTCILHSHTRISNFIANLISKKYHIAFVTTVHGHFRSGFWARRFSKWGMRALAVSDDLKTYLVDKYGYDADHIDITVNGINPETFQKNDHRTLRESLQIAADQKILLCVSRIEKETVKHIEILFNAAKEIYTNCSNCRIVIVGDGNAFEVMQKQAAQINSETTPDFIRMVGASTEVYKYYNIADAFVGLSRAALEAMACKVPTILVGNHGYLGILSEKTQKACIDTNFTCRECPYPTNKEIIQQIIDVLKNPQSYEESVEMGYALVKNQYSVDRMMQDALAAYEKAVHTIRPQQVMISGYYGNENLGDDVTLHSLVDNLQQKQKIGQPIILTSRRYQYKDKNYLCIHRFNLPKIIRYMKQTQLFMLGGGSLLQDATSSRSLFYYSAMLHLAHRYGCQTMLYGNGIGPIQKKRHQKMTAKILQNITAITLRDNESLSFLRSIGVTRTDIKVTADETYTIDLSSYIHSNIPVLQEIEHLESKTLLINLRRYEDYSISEETLLRILAKNIDALCEEKQLTPVLLPVCYRQDIHTLQRLSKILKTPSLLFSKPLSHAEVLSIIHACDYALLERLHPMIFSAMLQKPFVALSYDPKVSAAAGELGVNENCIAITEITDTNVCEKLVQIMQQEKEIVEKLSSTIAEIKNRADENCIEASRLLEII